MLDPRDVHSRQDLARFVQELAENLSEHPRTWENSELGRFLSAMSAWIEAMDGAYENRGEAVPEWPQWSTFAEILAAARIYE